MRKKELIMNQRGQVVVIILLVIVVALTIGLSIAGSAFKNLQETAVLEETNRAFSAAEAGIEEALLKIEGGTPIPTVPAQTLVGNSQVKEVKVETVSELNLSNLPKDEVAQLDTAGITSGGHIVIKWLENTSILITRIYEESGNYEVERFAVNCGLDRGNGFTTVAAVSGVCSYTYPPGGGSPPFDGDKERIIRIRAMYGNTSIAVSALEGTTLLPVQSTVITSTGQSGDTQRTIQVERSLPVPPAILDFVLFSAAGSLSK